MSASTYYKPVDAGCPRTDSSHDLIAYAQSWQWTDTSHSVPEALRVLRRSGALAVWWNTHSFDVPWIVAQHERIARHCGVKPRSGLLPDGREAVHLAGLTGLRAIRRPVRWSRTVPLDVPVANIGSRSAPNGLRSAWNVRGGCVPDRVPARHTGSLGQLDTMLPAMTTEP